MTALWIVFTLAVGVVVGFVLCAALVVGREDQHKNSRPPPLHPLESDSRF